MLLGQAPADSQSDRPGQDVQDEQPSLELLLHLAQWETADGEYMDPMLLSDEETEEDERSEKPPEQQPDQNDD